VKRRANRGSPFFCVTPHKFLSFPVSEVASRPNRPIGKKLTGWKLKTENQKLESCYIPISAKKFVVQGGRCPLIG
jgi:hypothetical protein